jgi:amino acid transporter
MPSGGSVSFVYGFIFCIICNICLSASVGELASLYPTAGGQYHYSFALSAKKWKNLMVRRLVNCIGQWLMKTELSCWMDEYRWLVDP